MAKQIKWTQQMVDLVGTDTDAEIAKRLGVSSNSVYVKRVELLRPAFQKQKKNKYDWSPEVLALLGTSTDKVVSEKTGIPLVSINLKRRMHGIPAFGHRHTTLEWTDEMLADLPTMNASEFSRRHNVNMRTVIYKCRELGLSNYSKMNLCRNERVPDWVHSEVGKWADNHIAEAAGVSRERIRQIRAQRGIPKISFVDVARREFLAYLKREGIGNE